MSAALPTAPGRPQTHDTDHYASRFLSRPSRTDGTIELAHLWCDRVMAELTLGRRDKALTVGADPDCDVLLEHSSLPGGRYALVTRDADGAAWLNLAPGMVGDVYVETSRYDLSEVMTRTPSGRLALTPTTRVRLQLGSSTLLVHQGTRPALALPLSALERHLPLFVLGSALVHAVWMALVYLVPRQADDLDLDDLTLRDDLASIVVADVEALPFELPEGLLPGTDEDELAAASAAAAGEEGRAGLALEADENRRHALAGEPDTERESLQRREPERDVHERGVLSVLTQLDAPSSPFGDVAMGRDDVTAFGAIDGPRVGPVLGDLGLGGDGPGAFAGGFGRSFSAGCGRNVDLARPGAATDPNARSEALDEDGCATPWDGFGTGPFSTRGRYGRPDRDLLEQTRVHLPERETRIDVTPGLPRIVGHLDRAVIQRIIREHRRELRDCYERELQRNSELAGRILVSFTITPEGNVARASIEESELGSEAVESCVAARFRRFVFPVPAERGLVHVNYPFVFTGG